MKSACCVLAALVLTAGTAHADVHATLTADGKLRVSEAAIGPAFHRFNQVREGAPVGAPSLTAPTSMARRPGRAHAFHGLVSRVASEQGVEAELLHAVIHVESGYNARVISHAGAIGLMQVMPSTGARFGARDLFDPGQNMRAGAAYLRWLLARYSGDISLALAAYNAGEGAVERYGRKIPPYRETRAYVSKVLAQYALLSGRMEAAPPTLRARVWSVDSG